MKIIFYYIDIQTHCIHKQRLCDHLPKQNREYLGHYRRLGEAVASAKVKGYLNANSCDYCCN